MSKYQDDEYLKKATEIIAWQAKMKIGISDTQDKGQDLRSTLSTSFGADPDTGVIFMDFGESISRLEMDVDKAEFVAKRLQELVGAVRTLRGE